MFEGDQRVEINIGVKLEIDPIVRWLKVENITIVIRRAILEDSVETLGIKSRVVKGKRSLV